MNNYISKNAQRKARSLDFFDPTLSEAQQLAEKGLIGYLAYHQGERPEPSILDALEDTRPDFFTGSRLHLIRIYIKVYRESGLIAGFDTILREAGIDPAFKGIDVSAELAEMMTGKDRAPLADDFRFHIKNLKELYIEREEVSASEILRDRLLNATTPDERATAFTNFNRRIEELEDLQTDGVESLHDIHIKHLIDIENKNIVDPIPTGFEELDGKLKGGLAPATLITIGARPSVGKSALMTQIAYQMAREGNHVLIFTMEMTSRQIKTRIITQQIDPDHLPEGVTMGAVKYFTPEAIPVLDEVTGVPISIADGPQTLDQIERITAKYRRARWIKAVFIDYAGLIKATAEEAKRSDRERLDEWAGRLKELAKKNEIPIVILSQLNREATKKGERPSLANLRGSDGIGNASDVLIFIDRPDPEDRRKVEIILDKNRDGATGIFLADFTPERVRFDNVTPKERTKTPAEIAERTKKEPRPTTERTKMGNDWGLNQFAGKDF